MIQCICQVYFHFISVNLCPHYFYPSLGATLTPSSLSQFLAISSGASLNSLPSDCSSLSSAYQAGPCEVQCQQQLACLFSSQVQSAFSCFAPLREMFKLFRYSGVF